jgi:hypothetical protein
MSVDTALLLLTLCCASCLCIDRLAAHCQAYLQTLTTLDGDSLEELLQDDSSVGENGTNNSVNSVNSDAQHVYSVTDTKQQQQQQQQRDELNNSSRSTEMPRPPHLKQVFGKLLSASGKRSKQQPLTEAALNSSSHSSSVQVVSPLHHRGLNNSSSCSSSNMCGGSSSSNMFASRSFDSATDAVAAAPTAAPATAAAAPVASRDAHGDLLEIDIESGDRRSSSSCDASADTAAAAAPAQQSAKSPTVQGRAASRATPLTITPLTVSPTDDVRGGASPDRIRPVSPASSVATAAGAAADQQVRDLKMCAIAGCVL